MDKIIISENKTLKLQNVLSGRVDLQSENPDLFNTEVMKMNTYIQTHGSRQIGPLIQYTKVDSVLRVKNCLYARYMGPEEKVRFAYDKLRGVCI